MLCHVKLVVKLKIDCAPLQASKRIEAVPLLQDKVRAARALWIFLEYIVLVRLELLNKALIDTLPRFMSRQLPSAYGKHEKWARWRVVQLHFDHGWDATSVHRHMNSGGH